ncbi:MAG TPA: B12-binding domain-containing protein [Pirellulaceae bacterium]|nr:B12-binding domain-containing protein [Pirellulaceae bacterium]
MQQRLTPRQLAQATGVSESSIKRWCDAGTIATVRTAGGHRRIPLNVALQFVRENNHELIAPEILGLPRSTGRGNLKLVESATQLRAALEQGQEERCRQLLFDLYLNQHRICEIGDAVIAPAFNEIGHRWETGDVAVFQERRALEITRNLLHELRLAQKPLPPGAPVALGGTLTGDNYALAPILVELVLRECGWRACYLGSDLPIATMEVALREHKPRLFWISVSHLEDEAQFLADYRHLHEAAGSQTAVVIGGRALHAELRQQITYSAYCETLQHIETFGTTLLAATHP